MQQLVRKEINIHKIHRANQEYLAKVHMILKISTSKKFEF